MEHTCIIKAVCYLYSKIKISFKQKTANRGVKINVEVVNNTERERENLDNKIVRMNFQNKKIIFFKVKTTVIQKSTKYVS